MTVAVLKSTIDLIVSGTRSTDIALKSNLLTAENSFSNSKLARQTSPYKQQFS